MTGTLRAMTGTPGLDLVLRGGLLKNHIYLVNGSSGAGKTTLAMQFLMEGARLGERCLYIGTSETEADMREIADSHSWDLTGITLRYHGGPVEVTAPVPEQTMFHPIEIELPRTMEKLMAMVSEVNPHRVVLDSLTEIRLIAKETSWFRDQVKILEKHFEGMRSTVLLCDIMADDPPVLRSLVHGVIEVEQTSRPYGPDRRRLRVAKMRGMPYSTGYHDVEIHTGGLQVYPRIIAAEERKRFDPGVISSGLEGLDRLLGGGIDIGTSTLVIGPTGTGKSVVATQYAVAAARRGEKCAMFVFDERLQTLYQRAAGLGLELERHVNDGLVTMRQIDPAELTPGQFGQAVTEAVDAGARIIIIDSLNGYSYAMPQEKLLELHLHELLSVLNQRGVTSIHVATQHGSQGMISQDFDVSYIADTVILLRLFEHRAAVRRAISVHKRRAGPHENTIRELIFTPEGLLIGDPLSQFAGVLSGQPRYLGDED